MVRLDDGRVHLLAEVVGVPPEGRQLLVGVERIVDARPRPCLAQRAGDAEYAGERGFLDTAAVGGAQDHDAQAVQGPQQSGGTRDRVGGHRGVRGAGRGHDGRVRIAGQIQARVDGDAVAADRDAGPVDVGVGLGVAGLNDARDVDAGRIRVTRELVRQADVDVPVGGLGELGHLGGLGPAHGPHAVGARQVVALVEGEDGLVKANAARLAGLAQSTHELRVARQVGENPSGKDALGRKDDVEVAALEQAGDLLDEGLVASARRAHGQGRLVGDEGAACQVLSHGAGRSVHDRKVGTALIVDDEGHDHDDGVGPGDRVSVLGRGPQGAGGDKRGQVLGEVCLAREGFFSPVDECDHARVHVHANDGVPAARVVHRQRQTNLAHADDRDAHGTPFPSPASLFPSSVVPRPTYNGGVDRALNLLLYPSNLASPGRLVKIARSLSPLFSQTRVVGIDQGDLPTDEAVAPTVRLTRIRGASLGARLGGVRVVVAWGARVYRRFAKQRIAAVSAQNLFLLPLAHALARHTGAVFAYNAHELETETVGSVGLRQRLQRVIERRYILRADVVSVVNESIAQWYRSAYPGVDPVVVTNAPTGADGVIDLRTQLGIPEGALLYLHSGYLAPGRNIPLILRAFEQVTSAHVAFVGSGALLPEVERAAAAHPNIHRLPPVEPDQVLAMTRGADVALCLIESGCLSHRLSTPNKMMEAFAAEVPALCSPLSEARRYLGDQAGTWVLEDPERDLIGALESITREDIEAFTAPTIPTWEEGAARLRQSYERALAARARRSSARFRGGHET